MTGIRASFMDGVCRHGRFRRSHPVPDEVSPPMTTSASAGASSSSASRTTAADWSPSSWRTRPGRQMPSYPDEQALADVERQLQAFPPLIFAGVLTHI